MAKVKSNRKFTENLKTGQNVKALLALEKNGMIFKKIKKHLENRRHLWYNNIKWFVPNVAHPDFM